MTDPLRAGEFGPKVVRAWRGAVLVCAAVLVWTFADLFTGVSLPGAALVTHAAFRGIVAPLQWILAMGLEGSTYIQLLLVGLLLALTAHRRPRWATVWWGLVAIILVAAELVLLGLAILMERPTSVGVAAVLVLWFGLLSRPSDSQRTEPGSVRRSRLVWIASMSAGLACSAVIGVLVDTRAEYGPLRRAGDALRAGSRTPSDDYAWVAAGVLGLGAVVFLWRGGRRPERALRAAAAGLVGVGVALAVRIGTGEVGPLWPCVLGVPACSALAFLVAPAFARLRDGRWASPRIWQGALGAALLPALLLLGQSYATRILVCPSPEAVPGLSRVAILPEVFRIALNTDASVAVLSSRGAGALLSLPLQPAVGALRTVEPGQGAGTLQGAGEAELLGYPEELVHLDAGDGFVGAMMPKPDLDRVPGFLNRFPISSACPSTQTGSVLFRVDERAEEIVDAWRLDDLCWASSLRWDPIRHRILLGWEYRSGFHTLDARGRQATSHLEPGLGDVIGFALDPDPAADRFFTASLWSGRFVHEIGATDLQLRRRVAVGGASYDIAYDARRDRLYVSSFYASRVRIIDAGSFEVIGTIPTGFGARALQIVPDLDLLLISSMYDGVVRLWDLERNELRAALPVGGHVKDFAVDEQRQLVYFWSQCGLMRLDLVRTLSAIPE